MAFACTVAWALEAAEYSPEQASCPMATSRCRYQQLNDESYIEASRVEVHRDQFQAEEDKMMQQFVRMCRM